ncbi:ABC transporter permease [Ignatzschineria cameli]|uniref:ABC transporter permease n=1 Tax=Ignatzschineria cameli TaxID=2182793 RepID=UPI0013001E07|nr:ABC transporter permease [Ignatzschineria cameli]
METRVTEAVVKEHYFSILYREMRLIFREKSLFFALFIYPLLVVIFYSALLSQGVIQKMPVSVVDMDRTVTSRSLIQDIAASPQVLVAARDSSLHDAKQRLLNQEVYGIVFIPTDFEKLLLANESPELTTFYNNQYMSIGSALQSGFSSALTSIITNYQAETMMNQGVARSIAAEQLSPIELEIHPVFNPTLNYNYTLTNGVVPTLLQILIMVTMVFTIVRDKYKLGGIAVPLAMANGSYFRYLFNKMIPYLLWFLAVHIVLDAVLILFFDMPIRGSLFILYLGTALFIIAAQLWAAVFALWLPEKVINYGAASSFSSPAFGFIGLFFPRIAMSWYAIAWGAVLPITWYVEIRLDQTIRGHELPYNLSPLLWLMVIALVTYIVVIIRLHLYKKGAKRV